MPFIEHRGPVHSVITLFIFFIPILAIYRKKAIPYLLAVIQHSLLGDYIAGGRVQLLWPLTTQLYGMGINIKSQTNMTLEWIAFVASIIVMLKPQDITMLFQPRKSNLILFIPTFTVLLPAFLSYPLEVPLWLIPPHLVYISIFSASIIISLYKILKSI